MSRKKSFKEDLTGRVFGSWTVVSYAGKRDGKQWWLCQCGCEHGTIKEVVSGNLKNGRSSRCPVCARRQPNPKNRGPRPAAWKLGKRSIDNLGYVRIIGIRPGDDRPKECLEHRLVIEQQLGRKLIKGENVHHKNLNRQDNQLANLELWTTHQPIGGRVADLVEYATTILNRYAPERLARQDE